MKQNGILLFIDVVLVLVFVLLIDAALKMTGFAQVKQLALLFVLLLFAFFSLLVAMNHVGGWNVLFVIFLILLGDTIFLYFNNSLRLLVFFPLVLIELFGFSLNILKLASSGEEDEEFEPELEHVENYAKDEEPEDDMKVEEITPEHSIVYKSEHKPGKYIASKTGSSYHSPKCDWAKRIKKANRVWLNDKVEAKKQGYKPHDCV
ncbi:hypothetical protein KY330_00370 [Candidatus Woesearchaeota archaeon]|nr:hypothetical protein [Candidatus Woesearchaeota archaeon]